MIPYLLQENLLLYIVNLYKFENNGIVHNQIVPITTYLVQGLVVHRLKMTHLEFSPNRGIILIHQSIIH
jgi:hypothetical protein